MYSIVASRPSFGLNTGCYSRDGTDKRSAMCYSPSRGKWNSQPIIAWHWKRPSNTPVRLKQAPVKASGCLCSACTVQIHSRRTTASKTEDTWYRYDLPADTPGPLRFLCGFVRCREIGRFPSSPEVPARHACESFASVSPSNNAGPSVFLHSGETHHRSWVWQSRSGLPSSGRIWNRKHRPPQKCLPCSRLVVMPGGGVSDAWLFGANCIAALL